MANTLKTDANSVYYEGLRDTGGAQFIAKQLWGSVTTDADSVKAGAQAVGQLDVTTAGNLTADSGGAPASQTSSNTSAIVLALPGGQASALFNATGTWVGTINWYASGDGGTTYQLIQASTSGTSTIGTSTTANGVYRANIAGFTHVAAVMHPYTSGTASVRINSSAQTHNITLNNATALGQATMANSAPVVIASDQTVPIKGNHVEVIGNGPGVVNGVNTDLIPQTDVSDYKWLSLQITGTFTATLQFQVSDDAVNWGTTELIATSSYINNSAANVTSGGTSVNQIWHGPIAARYFRVRATAFTSNASLAGTLELYAQPTSIWMRQVTLATSTIGGANHYHLASAASTNATSVKAASGNLFDYSLSNSNAAARYVKFYDKASTPTVGTDTPARTILVPAGGTVQGSFPLGVLFSVGIAYATTTGLADSDTNAVGAGDLSIDFSYK